MRVTIAVSLQPWAVYNNATFWNHLLFSIWSLVLLPSCSLLKMANSEHVSGFVAMWATLHLYYRATHWRPKPFQGVVLHAAPKSLANEAFAVLNVAIIVRWLALVEGLLTTACSSKDSSSARVCSCLFRWPRHEVARKRYLIDVQLIANLLGWKSRLRPSTVAAFTIYNAPSNSVIII